MIKSVLVKSSLAAAALTFSASAFALADYAPNGSHNGKLTSIGSDTLANLMAHWSKEFSGHHSGVSWHIEAEGSSTAPPPLTDGKSQFGPMSRKMKDKEMDKFVSKHGYKATPVRVAIDSLAVYVKKDNPIKGLNMAQVDAIFSSTLKCGGKEAITNWNQLGGADAKIMVYGRDNKSGTHGYFKSKATCKGDYRDDIKEFAHSEDVVKNVESDINAIGYSGIGYITPGVRAVPIAKKGDAYVEATPEMAAAGKYPLGRFLYVYVNKPAKGALDPLQAEFLRYVLSAQGQMVVKNDGYIPLTEKMVAKELKNLN